MIIEIGDKLVSADIFSKKFVCDLQKCKGACCVVGDAGAPLEIEEIDVLEDILEDVKPYMAPNGIAAVEKNGVFYMDTDNDAVTTLVDSGACAFATFTDDGTALCTIEQAYRDGKINWKKPISCALFPIRSKQYTKFEALNLEELDICQPACACGDALNVTVYRFLKEPIIRKYGAEFFEELTQIEKQLNTSND
jgi:hypothetical protein